MASNSKKIGKILLFIILAIWQLPQTLVGLIMLLFIGKKEIFEKRNYCIGFKAEGMPTGISLGTIAILSPRNSKDDATVAHEMDGHTVDSKIFGPLYLIVIGLPSLLWAWLRDNKKHPNYYAFYTEKWANKHAGLEAIPSSGGYYYKLVFKK